MIARPDRGAVNRKDREIFDGRAGGKDDAFGGVNGVADGHLFMPGETRFAANHADAVFLEEELDPFVVLGDGSFCMRHHLAPVE